MIEIQMPFVKDFADYHDIDFFAEELSTITYPKSPKIKYYEVAFDGRYWALFYTNKRPNEEVIRTLLAKTDFDFEDEDANLKF